MIKKAVLSSLVLASALIADEDEISVNSTSLGGYGELHLNGILPEEGDADAPKLDFHRFVLFFGHQFNDEWSFTGELELEHNYVEGGEATGELELEQAYVEWRPHKAFYMQGGVILFPSGFINTHHEPARFLSVERPGYNKVIIPTTWFGNGYMLGGEVAGFHYKLAIGEGLDHSAFRAKDGLRAGRKKGYKSSFSTLLSVLALDYTGINGLKMGASLSRSQLMENEDGKAQYNSAQILETHAQFKKNNVWIQGALGLVQYDALYDNVNDLETSAGGYLDLGYNVASLLKAEELELYPWVRYGSWDAASSVVGADTQTGHQEIRFGLSLLPTPQVAIKADFGLESKQGGKDQKSYNVGVGYDF